MLDWTGLDWVGLAVTRELQVRRRRVGAVEQHGSIHLGGVQRPVGDAHDRNLLLRENLVEHLHRT